MLDVAIIGGGLSGLALAHSLHARRVDWALFESRGRFGGRVLSERMAGGAADRASDRVADHAAVDLGATWYWPSTQPSIARLVEDLGLAWLPQPDAGQLLLLDDPNREPRLCPFDARQGRPATDETVVPRPGALHGGARRLVGGMGSLIDAFVQHLPASRLHRGHRLLRVADAVSHVELQLQTEARPLQVQARRVVVALPPRLAASRLAFEPALPPGLLQAMAATPTWMAAAAKVALSCERPSWREAAHQGNAWVTHAQAVLAEVFDAGPPEGPGALAAFLALDAARRREFKRGLPLLVESQFGMLFGAGAGVAGELRWQDWAEDADTCSEADLADDARGGGNHPVYGDPRLAEPQWNGRLWWAGSETARSGGGYLEGALSAAARVRRGLSA